MRARARTRCLGAGAVAFTKRGECDRPRAVGARDCVDTGGISAAVPTHDRGYSPLFRLAMETEIVLLTRQTYRAHHAHGGVTEQGFQNAFRRLPVGLHHGDRFERSFRGGHALFAAEREVGDVDLVVA